jgi:hypothetical protein
MALLALRERQLDLDLVALPVQRGGDEGVALALDIANKAIDFATVQEQLPRPPVVGNDMGRRRDQGRDLRPEQEQLAAANDGVTLADLRTSRTDRLEFPSLEGEAGLEAVLKLVLVACALVERNGLGRDACLAGCALALWLILWTLLVH